MANHPKTPMVDWFDPIQLCKTGIRTVLASIFGAYADKREMQAALDLPEDYPKYASEQEIWLDYIADLGDGWNSTYTMASLLAEPVLKLKHNGRDFETHHGRILIMGGDQVYPTASRETYRDRLIVPYAAAFPRIKTEEDDKKAPHLFVIPGNHDWYDGLSSFMRLFCRGRWIGGLKTWQSRSYFSIKLPYGWWLWGLDVQLNSDIDDPQLKYFKSEAKKMTKGDKVIIATPEPTWVYEGSADPKEKKPLVEKLKLSAEHNLDYLERKTIKILGEAELRLVIAGDLHHYAHYENGSGTHHKITAGGGGAFLHGTHTLPKRLSLEEGKQKVAYDLKTTFPKTCRSRMLLLWNLLFPFKHWKFSGFLGGFYLFYAWILQSASISPTQHLPQTFMEEMNKLSSPCEALKKLYFVHAHSPASVMLLMTLIGGLILFCNPPQQMQRKAIAKLLVGGLHGLLHLLLAVSLIFVFAKINLSVLKLGIDDISHVLAFSIEMLGVGGLMGGFLMGIYLLVSNRLGNFHEEEAFSALGIADYKSFIRLHIDATGQLTVYPIGVKKVPTKWTFDPNAQPDKPQQFKPKDGPIQHYHHLIEDPIKIT